ncbi:uracil-DNA glycosylase-like protein [Protomyces lactucae-debilis]|uniref:Uracil-DNA glycosylase-like protein n=1 Tax=Protomyces lactucae-debilis TaxID=2754530 RepID=A0A1Y2EW92_PROLT|nr:uracil-DNA glycosylase-like protein [Protomyces lactucae-debilis]ORY75820.1 uracil-DNA glycosylase-like protein [Protomyces lactucae-debilis]
MSSNYSPSVKGRKRKTRSYAAPSVYASLPQKVPDCIREGLTLLIVGLNPGVLTAKTGLHFASPTNLFWPLLYESNIITRPMKAQEGCACLVNEFDIGITNIIDRPTAESAELGKSEYKEAAIKLEEKIRRYRPKAISCSGKGIWEAIFRQIYGRPLRKQDGFKFGWQREKWACCADGYKCPVFVTMGTSGRVAAYSPAYKRQVFAELGRWVNSERSAVIDCNSNRERLDVPDLSAPDTHRQA